MFYFLTVRYDVGSLALEESSYLHGPFATTELRDVALNEEQEGHSDEDEVVNVTLLTIDRTGRLQHEQSFLLGEGGDEDDELDDVDEMRGDEDDELGDEDEDEDDED